MREDYGADQGCLGFIAAYAVGLAFVFLVGVPAFLGAILLWRDHREAVFGAVVGGAVVFVLMWGWSRRFGPNANDPLDDEAGGPSL
jgi:hypothetical protein